MLRESVYFLSFDGSRHRCFNSWHCDCRNANNLKKNSVLSFDTESPPPPYMVHVPLQPRTCRKFEMLLRHETD